MSEFAPIFENSLTTAVFTGSSLMFLAIFAVAVLHMNGSRPFSKPLMLKAGIGLVALCLGATAMLAWHGQTRAFEGVSTVAEGSMAGFIRESHNSPAVHRLPVQVIADYN
jgi:hypothetical protein